MGNQPLEMPPIQLFLSRFFEDWRWGSSAALSARGGEFPQIIVDFAFAPNNRAEMTCWCDR